MNEDLVREISDHLDKARAGLEECGIEYILVLRQKDTGEVGSMFGVIPDSLMADLYSRIRFYWANANNREDT